jgi:hypothetical protein
VSGLADCHRKKSGLSIRNCSVRAVAWRRVCAGGRYASPFATSLQRRDETQRALLMIEHGVGVTHRPLKVAQVDGDYFEELS